MKDEPQELDTVKELLVQQKQERLENRKSFLETLSQSTERPQLKVKSMKLAYERAKENLLGPPCQTTRRVHKRSYLERLK